MMDSHNLVAIAQELVDLTKSYLLEIQSYEDWSLNSQDKASMQAKLVNDFQSGDMDSLSLQEKQKVQELLFVCYQLELQINHEISRQKSLVSDQITLMRKSNNFKNKYEMSTFVPGIMFDTLK